MKGFLQTLIILIVFISYKSFSQRERGIFLDIEGFDLVKTLNNTNWVLKKVIYGEGNFAKKRKASKLEEIHLSFKDGRLRYFFPATNTEFFCTYKQSLTVEKTELDYSYLTIYCSQCNYYWGVYRLSKKKLVVSISISVTKDLNMTKLERYVFYRE
jgi:hypothetical protein